jgi:hypothetical protein
VEHTKKKKKPWILRIQEFGYQIAKSNKNKDLIYFL